MKYALAETTLYEFTGDDESNLTLEPFELDEARAVHAGFWRPG